MEISALNEDHNFSVKAGKNKTNGDISELPDDVLSSILSFLSMRDAVKARLLSSRWRYLSASPFTLDLSKKSASSWNDKTIFLTEVDQILQRCKTIPKIDTFKLHYRLGNEDACHIDKWISFAVIMKKTEKLDLNFSSIPEGWEPYNFPCDLLHKASYLKHLCLESCILRSSPESTSSLNSLKTIDLQYVNLDQSAFDTILSGCMNLRFLRLRCCKLPREVSIHGPFRQLNLLAFLNCRGADNIEILSIDRVVKFEYFGGFTNLNFVGVSSFEKARITCKTYEFIRFGKGFPQLESLSLLLFTLLAPRMDKFNSLKELELIVSLTKNFDLLSLASVLNACPNLQKFRLEIRSRRKYIEGGLARWRYDKQQKLCPRLEEVEVSGFCDVCCNALEFALYLLRGAVGLERMIVRMRGWNEVTDEQKERFREEKERIEGALFNEKMVVNPNLELIFQGLYFPQEYPHQLS